MFSRSSISTLLRRETIQKTKNGPLYFQRYVGNIERARRLKYRDQMIKRIDSEAEYFDLIEGIGKDYNLNWGLNRLYEITPQEWAFRNLHWRGLLHFSDGKKGENLSIEHPKENIENHERIIVDKEISSLQFKSLTKKLKDHLYDNTTEIYTQDGSLGWRNPSEVTVRFISESNKFATYMRHMLTHIPLKPFEEATFHLTVINGAKIKLPLEKFGIKGNSFSIFDPLQSLLVTGGHQNTETLRQDIFSASTRIILENNLDILPINCHSIVHGNQNALIFGLENTLNELNYTGVFNHFWNSNGVQRAWKGITYSHKKIPLKLGDLVETIGNSAHTTTSLDAPKEIPHPSFLIFCVSGPSEMPILSQISAEESAQLYTSGYKNSNSFEPLYGSSFLTPEDALVINKKFQQAIENAKTKNFVVNLKAAKKEDDVIKTIQSILENKAKANGKGLGPLQNQISDFLKQFA